MNAFLIQSEMFFFLNSVTDTSLCFCCLSNRPTETRHDPSGLYNQPEEQAPEQLGHQDPVQDNVQPVL